MKREYKILLISLYNGEAMGVRQLYSSLVSQGYDTKMVFLKLYMAKEYEVRQKETFKYIINSVSDKELKILVNFITDFKPKIIGISVVSSHFNLFKRIYSLIRNVGDFKIVLGGWQPTLSPESSLPYCDILCRGEGEEALSELAERMLNKDDISGIRNLWIKSDEKVIKNPVRPLNTNLDSLPKMVFDDNSTYYIEDDQIINKDPYHLNDRYGIAASRGCPYSCTYCSNSYMAKNLYSSEWSKLRFRSATYVMEELRVVKNRFPNITRINFYDETFRPDKLWLRDFFARYKKEIGLSFYCEVYPGSCDEEMVKIMKDGMLSGVWIGVQSGSERVRREVFKRYYTNALILKQADLFNRYGISVRYDFIFDNPFESFEESLDSINLMLEFKEPFSLNLFSLKYFPATDITKMALEAGLITEADLEDHLQQDNYNFLIRQTTIDTDENFINHVAMYISLLANKRQLEINKEKIKQIIEEYKSQRKIKVIQELLEPLLLKQ